MIPISKPCLGIDELGYLSNAIKTGWLSFRGPNVAEFENQFAWYCGTKYGVACSNGTSALHLALLAVGVKKNDEVIVPALTFASTAFAVSYIGAKPVFVDVHPESWCIDTEKIEQAITPKTKAIIPVHLYGIPCNMAEVMRIALEHNLYIIEDCAEAHGAMYHGKRVGSFSHVSCFSLFANKIITTGEGGMCLTDSPEYYRRIRLLQNYGSDRDDKKYYHERLGYNYRMTNLQAGVGLAQLAKLDNFISKREVIETMYDEKLAKVSDIFFPFDNDLDSKSVCWIYTVGIKGTKARRDAIIKKMAEREIETRPTFLPLNSLPMYANSESFPVAESIAWQGISLPTYCEITEKEIDYVCESLRECLENIK